MKNITFAAPCIKRYETDDFTPSGEPRFVAVALNGEKCSLQCDHCRTRMLKALYQVASPEDFMSLAKKLASRGCEGMLLTGGCGPDGIIPLEHFAEAAATAKERFGLRYAVHTKLVTEQFADHAGAELLMCDVVGETESLRGVYHLTSATVDDVRMSLDRAEARGLRLAPHIMIGIANGKIAGEITALEMLLNRKMAALALVVLTPLLNTPMSAVQVDVPGVLDIMTRARNMFPDVRLTLGCAKLGGRKQRELEEHALALGFDAIAYPSDGIVHRAKELGYNIQLSELCCALEMQPLFDSAS